MAKGEPVRPGGSVSGVEPARLPDTGLDAESAGWLRQVGVRTQEDLLKLGPVEAFMKVKRAGFRPSLNLLYSLAGAIENCHWADLPDERKLGVGYRRRRGPAPAAADWEPSTGSRHECSS